MILLIGNCQIERLFYILTKVNAITNVRYFANTEALDPGIDFNSVLTTAREANLVIAQPILNTSHPLFVGSLKAENKNILFVPYIFVDGFFSMSSADMDSNKVYGGELLLQHADPRVDLGFSFEEFRKGNVNFENKLRLEASIEELRTRERVCSVEISDFIVGCYRYIRPLISHNHPTPELFDVYCRRIGDVAGLPIKALSDLAPMERVEYIFGRGVSVFSPYDAGALGVNYEYDDYWFVNGASLINRIANC